MSRSDTTETLTMRAHRRFLIAGFIAGLMLGASASVEAHDCGCSGIVLNGRLNTADFDGGVGGSGYEGGSGGGGYAIGFASGRSFASASAFAFARASAFSASFSHGTGMHGGGMHGGGMHGGWGGGGHR
jgi:hypothetical protein